MITQADIQDFKQLYAEIFGVELSEERAAEAAKAFIGLYASVFKVSSTSQSDNNAGLSEPAE